MTANSYLVLLRHQADEVGLAQVGVANLALQGKSDEQNETTDK
jgi:hypothetical protein